MNKPIMPCLWFNTQAEEAATLYTSLFENSKVEHTARYGDAAAAASGRPKGSVMTVKFSLAGLPFLGLNGGALFKFNPALSFFVICESEKEIDALWSSLIKGGVARMELNKYPFADKYGFCEDRFGVQWQLFYSAAAPPAPQKIMPALLFTQEVARKAGEAMKFYTSLFPGSKTQFVATDEKKEVILHARFTLGGHWFAAMESPLNHDFRFNESVSFIIECDNQAEIDRLWSQLSARKESEACGWCKDKYGVSWQIVPSIIGKIMSDPDPKRPERVMALVMKMKKIEIEPLRKAYEG